MQKQFIPFEQTGYFSTLISDYLAKKPALAPFYDYPFEATFFKKILSQIEAHSYDRGTLQAVFKQQYHHLSKTPKVQQNLEKIGLDNTFTVVTGHQTNLFTGPLYFIYKIISVINLAERLKLEFPKKNFVPVYWMGSEDHDFEEINHIHIFGKKLEWQQPLKGATGRLSTDTIRPTLDTLKSMIGDGEHAQRIAQLLEAAYMGQPTLAKATQHFVNELFGEYGLLVLDQDEAELKKMIKGILKKELLQCPSYELVKATNQKLEKAGYHAQAYVRPINLFYLTNKYRKRISLNEISKTYRLHKSDLRFSEAQILDHLDKFPERFSPNVILRPVYQQAILPCVAYIGGGGELAYWLQLKSVFAHYQVHFPMLVLRSSVLWIDAPSAKRMKKVGLSVNDLFKDTEKLVTEYVNQHSENQLDLAPQKQQLQVAFEQILAQAKKIDPTLQSAVIGEMTRLDKTIERLEGKLLRAEKRNFDVATNQIRSLKHRLFPNNSLQERHDNFITFYLKYGNGFIETLKRELKPLKKEFLVLVED